MKTIAIEVPKKDSPLLSALLARLGLKSRVLTAKEVENHATAQWIMDGANSEQVSREEIMSTLKAGGA